MFAGRSYGFVYPYGLGGGGVALAGGGVALTGGGGVALAGGGVALLNGGGVALAGGYPSGGGGWYGA